jgi:hypothetical protein
VPSKYNAFALFRVRPMKTKTSPDSRLFFIGPATSAESVSYALRMSTGSR